MIYNLPEEIFEKLFVYNNNKVCYHKICGKCVLTKQCVNIVKTMDAGYKHLSPGKVNDNSAAV